MDNLIIRTNLTEDQIKEIIYLYENNFTIKDIGNKYKKDLSTIHRLVNKISAKRKTLDEGIMDFHEKNKVLTN